MKKINEMTSREVKSMTYNAYIAYVNLIEGKATANETVEAMKPLFDAADIELTLETMVNVLTVKMTAYGTTKGEKARKVKSIATFRSFFKDDALGWTEVATSPVVSNAGKAPAEPKEKAPKAKKPTKKELEDELASLKAQLAAMQKIA